MLFTRFELDGMRILAHTLQVERPLAYLPMRARFDSSLVVCRYKSSAANFNPHPFTGKSLLFLIHSHTAPSLLLSETLFSHSVLTQTTQFFSTWSRLGVTQICGRTRAEILTLNIYAGILIVGEEAPCRCRHFTPHLDPKAVSMESSNRIQF